LFVALAFAAGAAGAQAASAPAVFHGQAVWLDQVPAGATSATLAAALTAAGSSTVYVKAADGTSADPQFTPTLVAALHAAGVRVCAWTVIYGVDPAAEAALAATAAQAGADCVVYDAEGPYDGRYGAAQQFITALRAAVGPHYPLGLATQPYVLGHQTFPYSVFLAPGASDAVLPLMYWLDLHQSVHSVFATTFSQLVIYERPILPVGQLYRDPSNAALSLFRLLGRADGAAGESFFDLDSATPQGLGALAAPLPATRRNTIAPAPLAAGADGDEVVQVQELLNAVGGRLPVGGFYGSQTAHAVGAFQRAHQLRVTGRLDRRTWARLLRAKPQAVSWLSRPPESATG
jgi:hypothetical protein